MNRNLIASLPINHQELAATRQYLVEQNKLARQTLQRLYQHQTTIREQQLEFEQRLDQLLAKINQYKADWKID